MRTIAKILHCSEHKVVYWMRAYKIDRRTRSEAAYMQLNPAGDPFHIKTRLTNKEYFLMGLGLGIYWGEGTKSKTNSARVANTDPHLLRMFRQFLRKVCQVREDKIHYSIVCFNDTSPTTARDYWSNQLEISGDKFGKITQIPTQGKGTYKKKSQFGVCTLSVGNVKLKAWILNQLSNLHA